MGVFKTVKHFIVRNWIAIFGVLIYSIIAFLILGTKFNGLYFINPTEVDWIMSAGDWPQHYLGFAMYRASEWSFPIGHIEKIFPPMGTNIGFTDTLPLFAIPLKAFSGILPKDFQFIGFWFYLCFLFQGISSYRLLRCINLNIFASFVGSLFFCLSTVLMFRTLHDTLCCHFLILELLIFYFKSSQYTSRVILQKALLFSLLTAFIHPYWVVFVMGVITALYVKYYLQRGVDLHVIYGVFGSLLVFIISWYLIGYFSYGESSGGEGFGYYSANLNTFFNPNMFWGKFSRYVSPFSLYTDGQYEGAAYLGLGVLIILFIVLIHRFLFNQRIIILPENYPIIVISFLLFFFSLSNVIAFGSIKIMDLTSIKPYAVLGNVFRSSGRYTWLLYYLILLFVIWYLNHSIQNKLKLGFVLVLLFFVQFLDLKDYFNERYYWGKSEGISLQNMNDAEISNVWSYPLYQSEGYIDLVNFAYKHDASVSSFYLARENINEIQKNRVRLAEQFKIKGLKKGEVMFLPKGVGVPNIKLENISIQENDKYFILMHKDISLNKTSLKIKSLEDLFIENSRKMIIMSVKDEASQNIPASLVDFFTEHCILFSELGFRHSGLVVYAKGEIVYQDVSLQKTEYNSMINDIQLDIVSAGNLSGNLSSIKINDEEFSQNRRGINVVVVDEKTGKVEKSYCFDTYSGENLYFIE